MLPRMAFPPRRPAYSTAAALTSFALSLLLVYRTNAAYGRWAEMRTACGRMLVHLRVLLRLVGSRLQDLGNCCRHAAPQAASEVWSQQLLSICAAVLAAMCKALLPTVALLPTQRRPPPSQPPQQTGQLWTLLRAGPPSFQPSSSHSLPASRHFTRPVPASWRLPRWQRCARPSSPPRCWHWRQCRALPTGGRSDRRGLAHVSKYK